MDHMVQSHPAYTQLQEQARHRSVHSFTVGLLGQFLADSSTATVSLCSRRVLQPLRFTGSFVNV